MKFSRFAKYLQQLEETSKRLEITSILTSLIKESFAEEIDKILYLSLGYLKAPFESEKFNIAEKMMLRALETAYDAKPEYIHSLYTKYGDLGDVTYKLDKNKTTSDMAVSEVHTKLLEIAQTSGIGSQEAKITKLANLLHNLSSLSAKYAVRIVLSTTRLGFTELTVLDALTNFLGGDKKLKETLEQKYSMHPDIGLIARKLKNSGLKGLNNLTIEPGVPILAQKCQRLSNPSEILEKMSGIAWAEFKFDGTRVQLHMNKQKKLKELTQKSLLEDTATPKFLVKTYTRNLEETTHQFPDIITAATKQIKADSVILDGEAVGYDIKTGKFLAFQDIIKRKRKHNVKETAKEIPLKYFVFDILYLNGKSLMDKPLRERRKLLDKIIEKGPVLEIDAHTETQSPEEITRYFEGSKEKNLEGLVIKNPASPYQAGARSFEWIKLKKAATELLEDDFDCAVLGYYHGQGVRANLGIGGFLIGIYDQKEDLFKSITKVGTGLKDTEWEQLKAMLDKSEVDRKPKNVDVKKELFPDVWVTPKVVVVIKADEITKSPAHTAEYALRFPRFVGFRKDKSATDATTLTEIINLYKNQKRGYY